MVIDEKFRKKRKEQRLIIEEAIDNNSSIKKTICELIENYNVITTKELDDSKQKGYITIRDLENNEVVGVLYIRKELTSNQESNYSIELILCCKNSKTSDIVVSAINDFYSEPFCCVKIDSLPDMTVVVFKDSMFDNNQIYKEIASDFGASGRIFLFQEDAILELQDFSSSKDNLSVKDFCFQDLINYVSQDDEEDFKIDIPHLNFKK